MTLNDLKPPEEAFWRIFFAFLAAAHTSRVSCDEMAGDRPKQPAYEIFSIKHRFWKSKFQPPKFRRPVHASDKQGYPYKNWLF